MPEPTYTTHDPHVVHEAIDGEVVIVNLESGTYYSAQAIGAVIWQLVTRGHSASAIADRLATVYPEAAGRIATDVEALLETMRSEGLIVPVVSAAASTAAGSDDPPLPAAYETPELSKYVDMQNLLLVDPIHEVSEETGWPAPKD